MSDPQSATANIPPENGKRASIDPRSGEVHGSGAGAGGGNPGEDYDSDSAAGDGAFPSIPSARDHAPAGGQPVEKVEDRENVGIVTPEDYPLSDRAKGDPPG
jgi:hypothetical protein